VANIAPGTVGEIRPVVPKVLVIPLAVPVVTLALRANTTLVHAVARRCGNGTTITFGSTLAFPRGKAIIMSTSSATLVPIEIAQPTSTAPAPAQGRTTDTDATRVPISIVRRESIDQDLAVGQATVTDATLAPTLTARRIIIEVALVVAPPMDTSAMPVRVLRVARISTVPAHARAVIRTDTSATHVLTHRVLLACIAPAIAVEPTTGIHATSALIRIVLPDNTALAAVPERRTATVAIRAPTSLVPRTSIGPDPALALLMDTSATHVVTYNVLMGKSVPEAAQPRLETTTDVSTTCVPRANMPSTLSRSTDSNMLVTVASLVLKMNLFRRASTRSRSVRHATTSSATVIWNFGKALVEQPMDTIANSARTTRRRRRSAFRRRARAPSGKAGVAPMRPPLASSVRSKRSEEENMT